MKPIAVSNVGIICPVGLNTLQSVSSFRAGVSRKCESPFMGSRLEPIILGHLADEHLPSASFDSSKLTALGCRLLQLAKGALREALAGYRGPPLPLLLAGPQPAPGDASILTEGFIPLLREYGEASLDLGQSRMFALGRAGLFPVISAAIELLESGSTNAVLVGGVDSYHDRFRLERLDIAGRLDGAEPGDRMTPGEGAAFLLLATPNIVETLRLPVRASIVALGLGSEPGHLHSDHPSCGDGLSAAFASMFAQTGSDRSEVSAAMLGINGETHFAKEWGVASLRHSAQFAPSLSIEHPAEFIGDAGAALSPIMVGAAAIDMHRYSSTATTLICAGSDQQQRGALLLRPTPGDRR